jgi:hypothetical protein
VYRSLARILTPGTHPIDAVIVCMDVVGTGEEEFFTLVARFKRNLKVYVYTAGPDPSRTARAIQRGATGLLSHEVVQGLLAAARSAVGGSPGAESQPVQVGPAALPQPVPPSAAVDDSDFQPPSGGAVEDEIEQAPRVPWLRYAHRPTRTPPANDRTPSQGINSGMERFESRDDAYEPLLTEAELQALMSDDISTIAPKEPRRWADDAAARGQL